MQRKKQGRSSASRSGRTRQRTLFGSIWDHTTRPSDAIADVMAGKTRLEDQQDGIRSACALPIHEAALAVLRLPNKEKRREAISAHPETIRPYIESEVKRLWALDRQS
jgi:hypothetical protein